MQVSFETTTALDVDFVEEMSQVMRRSAAENRFWLTAMRQTNFAREICGSVLFTCLRGIQMGTHSAIVQALMRTARL
ncbi:MAG: hypothetical protein ACPGSC_07500 [Granulosicoccaceae bacterium]